MKLLVRAGHGGKPLASKEFQERIGQMRARREASGRGIDWASATKQLRRRGVLPSGSTMWGEG